MTKWKTDDIRKRYETDIAEKTAGWSEGQLRSKLVEVLTAVHPIQTTLDGLVDNPDYGRHGGMSVSSGLFMDLTLADVPGDFPEPYGFRLEPNTSNWTPVHFKWNEPLPERLQTVQADFDNGQCLHPNTEILSVWQSATACSIFVGSFDASDVINLTEACRL